MPRVRVKPWTLYEEAVGLANCRRISYGLSGLILGNFVVMVLIAANFTKSKHMDDQPIECSRELTGELDIEHQWDNAISAMRGREEMQRMNMRMLSNVPR